MRTVFVLYWLVIVAGVLAAILAAVAQRMRTFLRENGLSLFFAATFLATLIAQSFAGQHSLQRGAGGARRRRPSPGGRT